MDGAGRWLGHRLGPVGLVLLVLAAGGALVGALLGGRLVGEPVDTVLVAVAAGLVGAGLRWVVAGPSCLAGAVVLTAANQLSSRDQYSASNDLFFFAVLLGGPALAGALVTAQARQVAQLRRLAQVRAGQREAELRAARLDEHNRVETTLTQSMMQRMSGLVVQAAGARTGPGATEVRAALRRIEETGRATLDDLREALGSLRSPEEDLSGAQDPDSAAAPVPAPLGALDVLVASCGIPVAVEAVAGAGSRGPLLANLVAGLAVGAPLLLRRTRPLAAAVAFFAVATVMTAWLTPLPATVSVLLPLSLTAYALGAHTRGGRRAAGLAVLLVGGLVLTVVGPAASRDPDGIAPTLAWLAVAFAAGVVAAQAANRAARLRDLLARIESGRGAQVRLAVAEQRQAIARDLHDTVAHAMTVVCLHAEAAQRQEDRVESVEAALATIETASRDAMSRLRDGLRSLEAGDDLVRDVFAVADSLGVRIVVRTDALRRSLGAREGMVAQRVVREALVNAARHAPGASVQVVLVADPDRLLVEVSNRRTGDARYASGSGTGLLGLGELVRDHGGRLEHGAEDDRFRVAAWLPATELPA